jgi:hypothetical protein
MPRPSQKKKRVFIGNGARLENELRNERQKSVLLAELGRMRRQELAGLIEDSKVILERSKKLCGAAALTDGRHKRAS